MNSFGQKPQDDNLLNVLLKETYESLAEDNDFKNSKDLLDYYNQKQGELEIDFFKYGKLYGGKVLPCEYIEKTSCFRLKINSLILDFPSNWSVFSLIKKMKNSKELCFLEVSEEVDEVLKEVLSGQIFNGWPLLLACYNSEVYILGFSSKEKILDCKKHYSSSYHGPARFEVA